MFSAKEATARSKMNERGYMPTKKTRYFDVIHQCIAHACDHGQFQVILNRSEFRNEGDNPFINMNSIVSDLQVLDFEAAIIANAKDEPYALYITWGKNADDHLFSMIDPQDHIYLS